MKRCIVILAGIGLIQGAAIGQGYSCRERCFINTGTMQACNTYPPGSSQNQSCIDAAIRAYDQCRGRCTS